MATSITTAFIKQFESEVHMAYQLLNNEKGNQADSRKWAKGLRLKSQDTLMFQLWKSRTIQLT